MARTSVGQLHLCNLPVPRVCGSPRRPPPKNPGQHRARLGFRVLRGFPIVPLVVPYWGYLFRFLNIELAKPKKELEWRL